MIQKVEIGTLVVSIQGSDKGTFYIVKEIQPGYALCFDGCQRHYNNPKKKNLKHLQGFSLVCVPDAVHENKTNNDVHKLIKIFKKAIKNL